MWLLITAVAAIIASILWRVGLPKDRLRLGFLSLLFWGATLMWLVDSVIGYVEDGGPFLTFDRSSTLLGVSVLALGLAIWLVRVLLGHSSGRMARHMTRR